MTKPSVLVVPASDCAPWLRHGFLPTVPDELFDLMARAARFVPRDEAETTDDLKQIVPYAIVTHGDRCFLYGRRTGGGEQGLWHRTSIGFGGHIEPEDAAGDPLATIMAGLRRELAEEIAIAQPGDPSLAGVIDDAADPVGRRHLGIAFRVPSGDGRVRLREPRKMARIGRGFFTPRGMLPHLAEMESWSRLCAEALFPA